MAIVRRIPFAPHAALVVALLGRAIQPARADADSDLLKLPSLWIKTLDFQAGAGYKDNVLLRHQNLVSSPFLSGEVDGSLYRLPIDGWEYMFFGSGEYDRYLNAPQINQEATVLIEGQVQKSFAQNWKAGVSAEYGYFDQVVDTSTVAELILPVPVQGNSFTIRPSVVRSFANGYGVELQLPGTRQLFNQFVDDYWQAGSRLILRREYRTQVRTGAVL